jgi:hypothetical protein
LLSRSRAGGSAVTAANSGGGDDNSFYRADNFNTALNAVKGKVGTGGDILEIRVEAKAGQLHRAEGQNGVSGWLYRPRTRHRRSVQL